MGTRLVGTGLRLAAALAMVATAAASCQEAEREAALTEARQKWAAADIDDYSWTVEKSCFCIGLPGQVNITVVDGVVTATSAAVDPDYPQTVDDMFQLIEDSLDADDLVVSYNRQLGYPELISIDFYADAIDDEVSYAAGEFRS
jgi:hypothetical protein